MENREEDRDDTILEALDYDYCNDVDMLDATTDDDPAADPPGEPEGRGAAESSSLIDPGGVDGASKPPGRRRKKKRNRSSRRGGGAEGCSITNINKFVVDTCRVLKERKSYLVWSAIGCLGVAAISDLVKEVTAIQACGGQMTADGSRSRNGGGILWNILKTREPKAYKEIMAKGREFEKQFRPQKSQKVRKENDQPAPCGDVPANDTGPVVGAKTNGDKVHPPESGAVKERRPVLERIRAPVSYDDLFEEGEIV